MRNLLVVFLITLVVPMLKGQSLDDAFSKTSLCDSSKSRIDLNGLYSCLSEKGINFKTGLTESNTTPLDIYRKKRKIDYL